MFGRLLDLYFSFFFFNDTATTEIYTLSLHDALPISRSAVGTETFDPRDDNLGRALESIDRAAADGADLVVFGELYLSGYRTDEWLHRWATVIDPPDAHVQSLVERAGRHRLTILM